MMASPSRLAAGQASAPPALDRIEAFLIDLVAALVPEPAGPAGRGRPRVLPALALWGGLLVCVLRGWSSQRALWRLLAASGLWHFTRSRSRMRRSTSGSPTPTRARWRASSPT